MSLEFLVALNNKTISTKYDDDYFSNILSMIKDNYDASEVMLIDKLSKRINDKNFFDESNLRDDDYVINITDDKTKKLVLRNNKKAVDYEELLSSILNNIFKNKAIIEKLQAEKYTDSLLKVRNRYAYDEILTTSCSYNNLGVVFIDADGLGIVNNMYGYNKGDELLKTIAKSLTDNFRISDVYRIGGDEFVIICPNISNELFHEKLANIKVYLDTTPYTASYGVVYKEKEDNLNKAVEQASIRMKKYKEKYRQEHPDKYKVKYKGN